MTPFSTPLTVLSPCLYHTLTHSCQKAIFHTGCSGILEAIEIDIKYGQV